MADGPLATVRHYILSARVLWSSFLVAPKSGSWRPCDLVALSWFLHIIFQQTSHNLIKNQSTTMKGISYFLPYWTGSWSQVTLHVCARLPPDRVTRDQGPQGPWSKLTIITRIRIIFGPVLIIKNVGFKPTIITITIFDHSLGNTLPPFVKFSFWRERFFQISELITDSVIPSTLFRTTTLTIGLIYSYVFFCHR